MRMPSSCTSSPRATLEPSKKEARLGPELHSKRLHTGTDRAPGLTTNASHDGSTGLWSAPAACLSRWLWHCGIDRFWCADSKPAARHSRGSRCKQLLAQCPAS